MDFATILDTIMALLPPDVVAKVQPIIDQIVPFVEQAIEQIAVLIGK